MLKVFMEPFRQKSMASWSTFIFKSVHCRAMIPLNKLQNLFRTNFGMLILNLARHVFLKISFL